MTTERFDRSARTWDEAPQRVAMAREIAKAIAAQVPLGPAMRVLDFGCGTGLMGLELLPRVGALVGADTSPGMLAAFREKVEALGLSNVTSRSLDPARLDLGGPYDLIASSMTLHHVPELAPLFQAFRAALRPGGRIALADLDTEDGSFHEDPAGVHHQGFDRQALMEELSRAGFADLEALTATLAKGRYPVFLVTGRLA